MQADANYFNGAYDAEIVPPQPDSRGMLVDCTKCLSAQDQKELRGYFEGYRPKEARETAVKYLTRKYGDHVFEVVFVTSDNGKVQYRIMVGRSYLTHRLHTKAAKEQQ